MIGGGILSQLRSGGLQEVDGRVGKKAAEHREGDESEDQG